jgi:superoxide reductase
MTILTQIWKCEVCGNIIEILHEGADSLVCCDKPMILKKPQTQDPEKDEKHVPVIEDKKVKIGAIEHPMEEKHYIEWIEGVGKNNKYCKVFLNPGDKPEIEFDFEVKQARAYCNLHGLWKSEIKSS